MNPGTDGSQRESDGRTVVASQRLPPATVLSERYRIEMFLSRSCYGEEYRARDLADDSTVLVRALGPSLLESAEVQERLAAEVGLAARLEHKNIATTIGIYGGHIHGDRIAYIVSELIEGQTLREMIDRKNAAGRPFSLKGAYNVVAHLCNGLAYAHETTFHAGLSPSCILVNQAGRVKVTDFGIARTFLGMALSKGPRLSPLPPEAATGTLNLRADIYAMGLILFELLTGHAPASADERVTASVPSLPAGLDDVIATCLERDVGARFPDARALKAAIQSAVAPVLAPPPPTGATTLTPTPLPPEAAASPAESEVPAMPVASPPAPPLQPLSALEVSRPARLHSDGRPPGSALKAGTPPKGTRGPPDLPPAESHDEGDERWLVRKAKEKLDFGPYSTRDLRAQIADGKVGGSDTVLDTDGGGQALLRDHALFAEQVASAEAHREEQTRAVQLGREHQQHKRHVLMLLGAILLVVLAAAAGLVWHKTHEQPKVVYVPQPVRDNGGDLDFLKNVQITMKVDPPVKRSRPPAPPPKHGHNKSGKPNQFAEATSLDMSQEGGDETLDQNVVQRVMQQNFRVLVGCVKEERHRNPTMRNVDMDFIIRGSGTVSAVRVNGRTDTPIAGCMFGKMQSVTFPKFNGQKTHASFSLALR